MDAQLMIDYLSDPATLITIGVVAVGTLYYISTMRRSTSPIPASQCYELPVSRVNQYYIYWLPGLLSLIW